MDRARTWALVALLPVALVGAPEPAATQVAAGGADTALVLADPGDVVSVARAAQALFERRRIRLLPLSTSSASWGADERIGRFRVTYDEGEWYPLPDDERLVEARRELLAQLDSLQGFAPGSEWILGQRVWYRFEAGDLAGALAVARACGGIDLSWCRALEGFALHGSGRYREAEDAFESALLGMDPEVAERWRRPRWPVDGDVRAALDGAASSKDAVEALLHALWMLADPLYLVEGNDRRTEHYARWTLGRIRERARNPFRISWGSDLDQLTVRHGWEMGWERVPAPDFTSIDEVVGHKHPEGRDYMPPGNVLDFPEEATAEQLRADRGRPRSLYAPAYAPVLLPMDGQLALFPRGARTTVVTTHFLPDDTTWHADHPHPLPWMEGGPFADEVDRIGLFAVPVGEGSLRPGEDPGASMIRRGLAVTREGEAEGTLMLTVPSGDYVLSAESWSPTGHRAGRVRVGAPAREAPEDVATLSDLLLLRPSPSAPQHLEEALPSALPRARIRPGQTFAIGWEVAGLGFRPETLTFDISVERTDRSVLGRIGVFLRLTDRPRPLRLSWEEPGPESPGHAFHYLSLDLPALEPGRYEIRLTLRTEGRSEAVTTGHFAVER